jgi:putative two-component system response regulator
MSPPRILFVDDDAFVRRTLRRLLEEQAGEWRFNFASSAKEALDLLEAFDYDTVVTDFRMPGISGLDLLAAIRLCPRTCDVPVVMLTASSEPDLKRRALDAGATDLLAKPVDRDDLLARLRSTLRLKSYQDEIMRQNADLEARVSRRTAELERARVELIWRLGKAGEFRDSSTGHHVIRVGYFSCEIARALGLPECQAQELFHASPLHDIGKIGIPDQILLKPGKLTGEEWKIMKTHASIGAEILRSQVVDPSLLARLGATTCDLSPAGNPLLETAACIAECHHERWDGRGYPRGVPGGMIPLVARIATVADVYDALSSSRPYKRAFEEDRVIALMRRGAGTQFDPEVFAAFERCLPSLRHIREEFGDHCIDDLHADVLMPFGLLSV